MFILSGCINPGDNDAIESFDDRYTDLNGGLSHSPVQDGPLIEGTSLLGDGLVRPDFDQESTEFLYNELQQAVKFYNENPERPEAIIWIARKTAAMWRYQDAVIVLTNGIESYPGDPRFFRFRGHYLMAIREFGLARSDMEMALKLIDNTSDEYEPDFLDGSVLEPSSTLQYNIWFNYGLLEYFSGDFHAAAIAFSQSLALASNADTRLTASDWLYLSYMRAGDRLSANQVLRMVENDFPSETKVYALRMQVYNNELQLTHEILSELDPVEALTLSYGAAVHRKLNNDAVGYLSLLNQIIDTNLWAPFSYIAAEADLQRIQGNSL